MYIPLTGYFADRECCTSPKSYAVITKFECFSPISQPLFFVAISGLVSPWATPLSRRSNTLFTTSFFHTRLETILTNHLVLNLRMHAELELSPSVATAPDMVFCQAYSRSRTYNEARSVMDTILGNIGESLRVHEESEETGSSEETIELDGMPRLES